ncbi:peptidoglycan DD-metalloendopeptidase family protein [Mesorhizobium sp. WSM2239]|uniref:Peptidoglycan DD-metalloendopeptidase family protein n=2 Tax=unclassified Mesorhizobium TaxID=325217 RepID=A0AAU8D484_9HYPH
MRFSVFESSKRTLARSAAILLVAGMAAGCSQQVSRFGGGGIDDIFTASTPNQRQIIKQDQPFPGDVEMAAAPAAAPVQSGSVTRGSLTPISSQPLPAPVATAPAPSAKPIRTVAAPAPTAAPLDQAPTGAVAKAEAKTSSVMASLEGEPEGWSRAGGTQITAKNGETVYNLSRRFGVPANVVMKVNGLNEQSGLQAGQKVIIPTYVYSSKAPVSAPDSNPNVADAKSSTGTKYDIPANKVPTPTGAPQEKLVVLPTTPKVKESETPSQVAASTGDKANASGASGTYTVAAGDTLSRIAKKTGVGVTALKSANGLQDGLLRIGQTLTIPAAGAVASAAPAAVDKTTTATAGQVKEVVQVQPAAYTPPRKTEKLIEQADQEAPDATGIGRMRWPVRGRVISGFGKGAGKANDGIDIQVPEGTPVKAAENGVVIYAGDGLKEFGNTVLVRHEDGLVTVYGHASELKVARGEKVKRGQEIARSGMSGTTDAPKLHFEVRKNSAPVDPTTFLE